MFLHVSVSHSVHSGESAPLQAGIHLPGETPPLGRHACGQTSLRTDTLLRQTPSGKTPSGKTPLGRHPLGRHPWADTLSDTTDTVGGTHPTGMHTC